MADFSSFDDLIKQLLGSNDFKKSISGDVLEPITDDGQKKNVVKAALRCIFGSPQGVRKMVETKDHLHIKNKRNWQPFCEDLLNFLKQKHAPLVEELKVASAMFRNYKAFWPDCDAELSKDVEKARAAK